AVAVFVDAECFLILPARKLETVIKRAVGAGRGWHPEGIVAVAFNNLAGKARQICDATKAVLLKEITLAVRQDLIIGSQQDFINALAVQVPARARPVGFPFVDGMRPVIGIVNSCPVQGAFYAPSKSIVSQIIGVSVAAHRRQQLIADVSVVQP